MPRDSAGRLCPTNLRAGVCPKTLPEYFAKLCCPKTLPEDSARKICTTDLPEDMCPRTLPGNFPNTLPEDFAGKCCLRLVLLPLPLPSSCPSALAESSSSSSSSAFSSPPPAGTFPKPWCQRVGSAGLQMGGGHAKKWNQTVTKGTAGVKKTIDAILLGTSTGISRLLWMVGLRSR